MVTLVLALLAGCAVVSSATQATPCASPLDCPAADQAGDEVGLLQHREWYRLQSASAAAVETLQAGSTCIDQHFVDSLQGTFQCTTVEDVGVALPYDLMGCKTRGLGFDTDSSKLFATNECSSQWLATYWPSLSKGAKSDAVMAVGPQYVSSTQMLENVAPVFYAAHKHTGPSKLRFFSIEPGADDERLPRALGEESEVGGTRFLAVGFAKVDAAHHVIAMGMQNHRLEVWTSTTSRTEGYARSFAVDEGFKVLRNLSAESKPYSNFFLATDCSNNEPQLLATVGNVLDVYRLTGLGGPGLRAQLLKRRVITEAVTPEPSFHNKIFDGAATFVTVAGNTEVLAAPAGFAADTRVYRCAFRA